jgi:carbon storage regulator
MLVLSRKKNEIIYIGKDGETATITVVELRGDKVRIGIDAPRTWSVHRKEVFDAIQLNQEKNKTQE